MPKPKTNPTPHGKRFNGIKMPAGYVGTKDIAAALGVAQVTVENWGIKGKYFMRQYETPGGRKVYCMEVGDLNALMRTMQDGPQPVQTA